MNGEDERCCWLCLSSAPIHVDFGSTSVVGRGGTLQSVSLPCRCPSLFSHATCLAKWQLRKAGQAEEKNCRFCKADLPHWSRALLEPEPSGSSSWESTVVPMMTVNYRGQQARLPCIPGEQGEALFRLMAREVFKIDPSIHLDAKFEFKESSLNHETSTAQSSQVLTPDSNNVMVLDGFRAFDAACCLAATFTARKVAAARLASPNHQQGASPSLQFNSASVAGRSSSTSAIAGFTPHLQNQVDESMSARRPAAISNETSVLQDAVPLSVAMPTLPVVSDGPLQGRQVAPEDSVDSSRFDQTQRVNHRRMFGIFNCFRVESFDPVSSPATL